MSSSSSTVDLSSRSDSIHQTSNSGAKDEDEEWDIMDALCRLCARQSVVSAFDDEGIASLIDVLAEGPVSRDTTRSRTLDGDMVIPHFPPLSQAMFNTPGASDSNIPRTSEPITQGIQPGPEQGLLKMAEEERFRQLLETPMGFLRFEEWLEQDGLPGSNLLLRYFKDLQASLALLSEVKAVTEGIETVYGGSSLKDQLELSTRPAVAIEPLSKAALSLRSAQSEATSKLYNSEFKRFVTGRMNEQAKARLQMFPDHEKRGDLGEVFCLADPRLPDQPLVLVSDGFCRLSEYPRDRLIGRNCRFLQGPGTDQKAVKELRAAIEAGREHCTLLLNYTRTGKPFWNLLNMIPLRNRQGGIDYFLGAQIDVTSTMGSAKAFANLHDIARRGDTTGHLDPFTISTEVAKTLKPSSSLSSLTRVLPSQTGGAGVPAPQYGQPTTKVQTSSSNATRRRWIDKLIKPVPEPSARRASSANVGVPQRSPKLDIPEKLEDRMAIFSSAYSKLIVFDAKQGLITHVTPSLLAFLGYPIRTRKDRYCSSILQKSIIDLLVGQTSTETESIKGAMRKVIGEKETHSIFAGLLLADSSSALLNGMTDCTSDNGRKFARTLLHLTPVRDFKDDTQTYIAVVS